MNASKSTLVSFLGLGAMGSALVSAAMADGLAVSVWNRTPGKAAALEEKGAQVFTSVADALAASPVIVACLFDLESCKDVLYPYVELLRGKSIVNVTTTSPDDAREFADWAKSEGIQYLDGGIMAVPSMIGQPGSSVFYSGTETVFEQNRGLLELWGEAKFFGADAGMASLYDMALLSNMTVMFGGFFEGAALVASDGATVSAYTELVVPWLIAMAQMLPQFAEIIDGGDYSKGEQSLEFWDQSRMLETFASQGVKSPFINVMQELIQDQIKLGKGTESLERIFESIRKK